VSDTAQLEPHGTSTLRVSRTGLAGAGRRVGAKAVTLAALVLAAWVTFTFVQKGNTGWDFDGTLWTPAKAALDGISPYPPPNFDAVDIGNPSLYPPAAFLPVALLTPLGHTAALAIWLALVWLSPFAALRLVGVRDLRVHLTVLCSYPFVLGAVLGNLTLVLALLVALAWRYRTRPLVGGLCVGAAIALKLLLWPLLVWLLATRRLRVAASSVVWTLVLLLVPWAAIGFDGLAHYPRLLDVASDVFATKSESLYGVLLDAGLAARPANALALVAAGAILAAAARRARRPDGDERMLTLAVVAALVASPIVWPHYLILLAPCLGLLRPRWSPVWLAFTAFWLIVVLPTPHGEPSRAPANAPQQVWEALHASPPWSQIGLTAVAIGAVATCALLTSRRKRSGLMEAVSD
jgi:alpha-1,2-mannosyltransferase